MSRRAAQLTTRTPRRDSGAETRNRRRGTTVTKRGPGKSNPLTMKRFAELAERPRAPTARSATWPQWEKLPGFALLAYAISWFALLTAFIAA
jgi:hypothetical protein